MTQIESGINTNPLELARDEVDRLDSAILGFVAERLKVVTERVIPAKQVLGLPVTDNGREVSHRENLVRKGKELGIPEATVHAIFDPIVADARSIQIAGTSTFPEVDQAKKV